ncbi:hypothetical protein JCM11251_006139 [Rhodosporidiobolus azoricus]
MQVPCDTVEDLHYRRAKTACLFLPLQPPSFFIAMVESSDPPAPATAHPTTLDERVAAYSTNVLPADYSFDPSLSLDENYLVLTLVYARLSMSKRGNMACIIVDPSALPLSLAKDDAEPPAKRARTDSPPPAISTSSASFPNYPGRILSHSNNFPQPLSVSDTSSAPLVDPSKLALKKRHRTPAVPKADQSLFLAKASTFPELHAEARSICLAAAEGVPLAGATAYVSFPPCQGCLPLLVASGLKRLVYRQTMTAQACVELCKREGVECVEFDNKDKDEELKKRVAEWWKSKGEGRDETRTRLDRWWKEQEGVVMGAASEDDPEQEKAADELADEQVNDGKVALAAEGP